ncbi:MAG: glycogen synthase GlgA [Planctomycetes bacterium]|nr:glycogen synthase GlgA [Planctomycetota bacterium]
MRILEISPEAVPFAKTGGLGDVAGSLPAALESLGHQVALVLPLYAGAREAARDLVAVGEPYPVPVGPRVRTARLWKSTLPKTLIPVYLVQEDELFGRPGLYGDASGDYPDNAERFVFYCRAALEGIRRLGVAYDVVHCHDWQTALVPVYRKTLYAADPVFAKSRTVITVHNLAYQGLFWHWDMNLTGLDWSLFNWRQLEFWGKLNLLKGGLVFADAITTVSRRYAQEIQTREFGCGMEGVLADRQRDLSGVPNGIDMAAWDPATDKLIPAAYSAADLRGKAACKAWLQKKLGFPASAAPVLGWIGRLVDHKGVDLLLQVLEGLLRLDVQLAVLGTGEEKYHKAITSLAGKHPKKLAAVIGFNNQLAHEIHAGADLFLMPSRYEPCGLNQLYGLRYGSVPLVRETGGLADTVVDATPESLAAGSATGFVFKKYNAEELLAAIARAIKLYDGGTNEAWLRMVRTGMAQDWSWRRSAQEYAALFEKLCAGRA